MEKKKEWGQRCFPTGHQLRLMQIKLVPETRQMSVTKQQCRYRIIPRIPEVLLHAVEHHASKQNRTLFKNYTIQNMHKAAVENRIKSSPPSPNTYLGSFWENVSKRKKMQTFQGEAQQLLEPIVQSLLFCTHKTELN